MTPITLNFLRRGFARSYAGIKENPHSSAQIRAYIQGSVSAHQHCYFIMRTAQGQFKEIAMGERVGRDGHAHQ